ncbi:prenyltransferase/squalene oxidase repeat-containing protein [Pyrococcus woesei]|uniref:prenyltransferase/squalene oxidase repeat-containing protein n=1 Tax=Pyrococcus woesei TaxID=2262 RepID=UPI003D2F11D0
MRKLYVLSLLLLIILGSSAVSASILEYSSKITYDYSLETDKIKDLSLSLLALAVATDKAESLDRKKLWEVTEKLLSHQNGDGGWGYFYGSVSSVPDTGCALLALGTALEKFEGEYDKEYKIKRAINRGVEFLLDNYNGEGWGYLKKMPTSYYPTLIAVVALSSLNRGYPYTEIAFSNVLKNTIPEKPEELALWILAYYNIYKEEPTNVVEKLIKSVKEDYEYPLAAYVLLKVRGLDFEAAKLLAKAESYNESWTSPYYPIYTTMAFSLVSESIIPQGEDKLAKYCALLENMQNEDGGWGIYKGSPSDVRVTYYALMSMKICNPQSEAVYRGLEFMRREMEKNKELILMDGKLRDEYLYALLALLEYRSLDWNERKVERALIESSEWGFAYGKQPLTTALAIKALLKMGADKTTPIVKENIEWLLRIKKNGGWGFIFRTVIVDWNYAPEYPATIEIFNVLWPLVDEEDLKDTIELLRKTPPRIEWQKLYAYLSLSEKSIEPYWSPEISESENNSLTVAMLVRYYSMFPGVAKVNLYSVITELKDKNVSMITTTEVLKDTVKAMLKDNFNIIVNETVFADPELLEVPERGNWIVIAPISAVKVHEYNADVKVRVGEEIKVNDLPVEGKAILFIIPGRNRNGNLIFILYTEPKEYAEKLAEVIFSQPIIKYIHGKCVVITWKDTNNNGNVEIEEIDMKFLK